MPALKMLVSRDRKGGEGSRHYPSHPGLQLQAADVGGCHGVLYGTLPEGSLNDIGTLALESLDGFTHII